MCSCVLVFWCILCCWMAVVRAVNERVWHYDQNIVQIFNQNRGEQQQKNAGKTSTKIIMDACKQTYLCVPYICFTVSIRCAAVAAFSHIYHHMPFPLSSVNIWIHRKKIVFFCANWNETTRNETKRNDMPMNITRQSKRKRKNWSNRQDSIPSIDMRQFHQMWFL